MMNSNQGQYQQFPPFNGNTSPQPQPQSQNLPYAPKYQIIQPSQVIPNQGTSISQFQIPPPPSFTHENQIPQPPPPFNPVSHPKDQSFQPPSPPPPAMHGIPGFQSPPPFTQKNQVPQPPPPFNPVPHPKDQPFQPPPPFTQKKQNRSPPPPQFTQKKQNRSPPPPFVQKKQNRSPPPPPFVQKKQQFHSPKTKDQKPSHPFTKKQNHHKKNHNWSPNGNKKNNSKSKPNSIPKHTFELNEEEEEEELYFCPHPFNCTLDPEKHPWLYHLCRWDKKDCNCLHDPRILHFDNAPCPYGASCPYMENPEHRARFYHRGYPVYMEQCKYMEHCSGLQDRAHRLNFQHSPVPFYPTVTGRISSLLNPRDLVLCYRENEEILVNEKWREIAHNVEYSCMNDPFSREILDPGCNCPNGVGLEGWVRYHLHDEIICINRDTKMEYLLDFKHQHKLI